MRAATWGAALAILAGAMPFITHADPPANTAATAPAPKTNATPAKAATVSQKAKPCAFTTGSRLQLKPNECLSSVGRSLGRDSIESTGEITAGGALRQLDPSLSTH